MVSKGIVFCLVLLAFLSGCVITVAVGRLAGYSRKVASVAVSQPNSPVPETYGQLRIDQPTTTTARQFVPILMYHYIRDYRDQNDQLGIALSVSPTKFDEQLTTIEAAGYHTISLEQFISGSYSGKVIILTFDDGYEDHYTDALPILLKHHFTGTFFIVGGFTGRGGYMTKSQISSLKTAGMEIGGHTMTHRNLATAPLSLATQEITDSMKSVAPVFAYPSGKYSNETLTILTSLGVKAAVTTNLGVATDISNPLLLPRIRVKEQTDLLKVIAEETALAKKPLVTTNNEANQPSSTNN